MTVTWESAQLAIHLIFWTVFKNNYIDSRRQHPVHTPSDNVYTHRNKKAYKMLLHNVLEGVLTKKKESEFMLFMSLNNIVQTYY